jgi:heat shock protein HslJ
VIPSDNSIKGSTGCNRFFGAIKMEGETIKITNVGATKMMCANMDAENAFMEAINTTISYKIENDILKFLSVSNEVVMECSYLKD